MNEQMSNNVLKSNTSLVGIVCKDGVVLGSDKRTTAGSLIVGKDSQKIHFLTPKILTAYTGSVSDLQMTHKVMAAELRLKELRTRDSTSVSEAANFLAMMVYRNIRTPSMVPSMVGTIVAGVNSDGSAELYSIEPAGSIMKIKDYDANFSSGMPFILGLLERQWKPEITVKEATDLAVEALKSSTQRDSGSGNGIQVFTLTKDGVKQVVDQQIIPQYK